MYLIPEMYFNAAEVGNDKQKDENSVSCLSPRLVSFCVEQPWKRSQTTATQGVGNHLCQKNKNKYKTIEQAYLTSAKMKKTTFYCEKKKRKQLAKS